MSDPMELLYLLPEIWMAAFALLMVLICAFRGDKSTALVETLSIFGLLGALALLWALPQDSVLVMNGLFISDSFAQFVKSLILIGTIVAILLSYRYISCVHIDRPEFPVLMLFAALGMMIMVSSNDLITLYVGLELQSLSLYVLAAFRRDDLRSSEAGLKYFVLGALSSGILLYGISLIYGYAGTMNFTALNMLMTEESGRDLPAMFGLVFILAGLAFKVSAAPFHMWTPDVYEGAPTPITAFFASVPKVAAVALLMRVLYEPFAGLDDVQPILCFMAAASMIIGSLAAIAQKNIKRMLAYSSIGHVGVMMTGLAAGTEAGLEATLIYLAIYFLLSAGTFAVVLCLQRNGVMLEQLEDLKGLAKTQPLLGLSLVIFMFSLAGVPPLAGFFGKFYVFIAALQAGLLWLAILGVITSTIAAFYYLRIIKLIYFDEPDAKMDPVKDWGLRIGLSVTAAYMLLFCFYPQPILLAAQHAAQSLLGG